MAVPKPIVEGKQKRRLGGKKTSGRPALLPIGLDCPDWLDDIARAEWDAVARVQQSLADDAWITIADAAALALYCESFSAWRRARHALHHAIQSFKDQTYTALRAGGKSEAEARAAADLASGTMIKSDTGQLIPNPYVGAEARARKQCFEAAAALKVTPAARSKMEVLMLKDENQKPASRLLAT